MPPATLALPATTNSAARPRPAQSPSPNNAAITASFRESAAATTSASSPTSFTRGSSACSRPRSWAESSATSVCASASVNPRTVLPSTPCSWLTPRAHRSVCAMGLRFASAVAAATSPPVSAPPRTSPTADTRKPRSSQSAAHNRAAERSTASPTAPAPTGTAAGGAACPLAAAIRARVALSEKSFGAHSPHAAPLARIPSGVSSSTTASAPHSFRAPRRGAMPSARASAVARRRMPCPPAPVRCAADS